MTDGLTRGLMALCALSLFGACADAESPASPAAPGVEGAQVSITVSPLTLEGVTGVCYALAVYNGAMTDFGLPTPQLVWSRDGVCSGQFGSGAGGGITYVGPCDASEPNNIVTLGIESVLGAGGVPLVEGEDWQNPCPVGDECMLSVFCAENADSPVTFDITILRSANQGFFDIGVRFDTVFCSGKIDCSYDHAGDQPILLLHDHSGARGETAVVTMACTTGPWLTDNTEFYMNHLRVVCDGPAPPGVAFALPPALTGQEGNQWDIEDVPADSPVWQYASYFGSENLYCNGLPCGKRYVDFAVGYDPEAVGCRLEVEMAVARPGVFDGFDAPAGVGYPVLVGRVQLTPGAEDTGLPLCRRGALNQPWSGFYTAYTAISDEPLPFCFKYGAGAFSDRPDGLCDAPDHYAFLAAQPLLCGGGAATTLFGPATVASQLADGGCLPGPINPNFACGGMSFIPRTAVCDGKVDCVSGLDETVAGCDTALTTCGDGAPIGTGQLCDGIPDCLDGSDEIGVDCNTALIPCGNGAGFHVSSQICDGVIDCINGFDEGLGGSTYLCPQPLSMWTCMGSDQVILSAQVCDGWPDCDNGSDELGCP